MKKTNAYILMLATVIIMAACGSKGDGQRATDENSTAIDLRKNAKGDSMIYGLACDGCTDSVIVFLPYSGGDPDTIEIIDAKQARQVFGRPKIGDNIAIMLNPEDNGEATIVIDMDELKGSWCYMAKPQFRDMEKLPKRVQRRMMTNMPDSMKQTLLVEKEFGFELKRNYEVRNIGMQMKASTTDDQSPVEYPEQKAYDEWRLYNGKILLVRNQPDLENNAKSKKTEIDTAVIELLMKDSLVLRFSNGSKSYYRK